MSNSTIKIISPSELGNHIEELLQLKPLWENFNTESIEPGGIQKRLEKSNSFLILAFDVHNLVIGFAMYSQMVTPLENDSRIEVWALFVDDKQRVMGFGSKLLEEIIKHGESLGCIGIHVTATNGLVYEKAGFQRYSIDGRFYYPLR